MTYEINFDRRFAQWAEKGFFLLETFPIFYVLHLHNRFSVLIIGSYSKKIHLGRAMGSAMIWLFLLAQGVSRPYS